MQKKQASNKISTSFLTNSHLRKIRGVVRNFFSKLQKIILFLAVFLLALLLMMFMLKPDYLKKKYDAIVLQLSRQISFESYGFAKINISGNHRVSSDEIIAVVKETAVKNLQQRSLEDTKTLIQNIIDEVKSELPWIHKITVVRSIPDTLNISVTEYVPFAIWQNDDRKYIIDKEGNPIPVANDVIDSDEFRGMVILSGLDANLNAKSLFNIFAIDPELSKSVYSATWVGNRRWDIRFENGLLIKLPEKNISKAWQHLIEIYRMPGSLVGLRVIDLRVEDKIYLKYDDAINKEIQKL